MGIAEATKVDENNAHGGCISQESSVRQGAYDTRIQAAWGEGKNPERDRLSARGQALGFLLHQAIWAFLHQVLWFLVQLVARMPSSGRGQVTGIIMTS